MTTIDLDLPAHAEPSIHALFAHSAVLAVLERDREYQLECEMYARDGHRPHYCKHGTNQWVDYDNICGPCEDSLTVGDEAGIIANDSYYVWELAGKHLAEASTLVQRRLMPVHVLEAMSKWHREAFMDGMSAGGRLS